MSWPPRLLLLRDHLPWCLDATTALVDPDALAALPWDSVFADLHDVESGGMANTTEHRQVGHYWLRAPERAPTVGIAEAIGEAVGAVRALASDIRAGRVGNDVGERFTDVVHLGVGGSVLGPRLLVRALDHGGGLRVHFVDNIDPDGIQLLLAKLGDALRTTLLVIVSKSGTTLEPVHALGLLLDEVRARGVDPRHNLVAVTSPTSPLAERAVREGWRAVFPIWPWVGGRFSGMSTAGLFGAELVGADSNLLLAGARDMDAWTRSPDPLDNPAAVFAGVAWTLGHGRGDKHLVVLPYADRLQALPRFAQAVFMESLGKATDRHGNPASQGLTVYGHKGSTDQHAIVQQLRDGRDDTLTFLVQVIDTGGGTGPAARSAGDHLQGFLLGTRRALTERRRASLVLTVPQVDAYTLGGIVALFERTVGMYASLAGLNAYDQPGVEAGKRAADDLLELASRLETKLIPAPLTLTAVAAACDANPTDALYLLQRLASTGRVQLDGSPLTGLWRKA